MLRLLSVTDEDVRDNFEKRHIGSLARLGLLPSFRFTGGRYSRSGRARLLLPSQEIYRSFNALISRAVGVWSREINVMCFSAYMLEGNAVDTHDKCD